MTLIRRFIVFIVVSIEINGENMKYNKRSFKS